MRDCSTTSSLACHRLELATDIALMLASFSAFFPVFLPPLISSFLPLATYDVHNPTGESSC